MAKKECRSGLAQVLCLISLPFNQSVLLFKKCAASHVIRSVKADQKGPAKVDKDFESAICIFPAESLLGNSMIIYCSTITQSLCIFQIKITQPRLEVYNTPYQICRATQKGLIHMFLS